MKILTQKRCVIGEGPIWNEREGLLYFVNGIDKEICTYDPERDIFHVYPQEIGVAAIAFSKDGRMLVTRKDGALFLDLSTGKTSPMYDKTIQIKNANDAKVGPDGCFYVGTTDANGMGAFYRLKDGVLEELFDHCGCSNGLDWTVDESRLFYCDTRLQKIEVFDFDKLHHTISNRKTFVEIPKELGCPDGFCMDENDHIWLGLWDGNAILEVKPDGSFGERIDVPAKKASCCIFAGEGLDDLIITTASKGDVDDYPLSGYVFMKKMNVKGKKSFRYKGETNMKKDVMQAIADTGILPVINITDITTALPLAKAILDGGLNALEITLRSEVSLQAISEIVKNYPDLHILAGTVLTVEQAQEQIEFAAAASCLKQSIELDVNISSVSDILSLMGGNASGRVQR